MKGKRALLSLVLLITFPPAMAIAPEEEVANFSIPRSLEAGRRGMTSLRVARIALPESAGDILLRFREGGEVFRQGREAMLLAKPRPAGQLTWADADNARAKAMEAAEHYRKLSGDDSMRLAVQGVWDALVRGKPLPDPRARLTADEAAFVSSPDKNSLYRAVRIGREKAMDLLDDLNGTYPLNMLAGMQEGGSPVQIPALYLSKKSIKENSVVPLALRAMAASRGDRRWAWVLDDRHLLARFQTEDRTAGIYVRPGSSKEDGMLRVRYEERDFGVGSRARVDLVAETLYDAGFSVYQRDGAWFGVMDPDNKIFSAEALGTALERAVQVLSLPDDADSALAALSQESGGAKEFASWVGDWARLMAGRGSLPFYVPGRPKATAQAYRRYRLQGE